MTGDPIDEAAAHSPPRAAPVHDTMRRIQIGIAGVLIVLLLVSMAGLIGDRARENADQDAATAAEVKMPGDEPKTASVPLEELGVQPVSKDGAAGASAKAPQAPAVATVPDLEPDPELQRARKSNP